ncbi:recombination protein NinG [Bacteroides fragilis]|nr:recombination protein NinG [Bacteroides fragilis]
MYYIKRTKSKKKDKPLPLFDKAGITVKKKPDLKAKLDKVFSLYIRLRDSKPFNYRFFKCISCGEIKPFEQADCGHFHSRRHLSTRFDEDNAHAECRACNRFSADHLINYEKNLIAKIGQQKFDLLKVKAAGTSKMSDFEYEQLIKYYKALNKKLRKEKGL